MTAPSSAYDNVAAVQRRPPRALGDGSLDLRLLVRLATLAASSHNTQPWIFRLENRSVTILPDFSRRCPVVDPVDGHLFKSLGCAAENLVQAAAAQNHAAHVSFDATANAIRIALEPSSSVRANDLVQAISRRQCTRTRYDGRAIDAAARKALEAAGSGESVRTVLIDDHCTRDAIVDWVRQGDLAQFGDSAFRKELIAWMRFNDSSAIETGDGLAGRVAGQPSLPDWLARRVVGFVLRGKAQARIDEANILSSPLIAVVVGNGENPASWIEAGRACQRLALRATALDIRSAFINQPIEVPRLRPALHRLLGLKDEVALLMLRLGYGPLAPYSLRRPVDAVIAP